MMDTRDVIMAEMIKDDCYTEDSLQRAYENEDIDFFLISLTGWSWTTLQIKRKEENNDGL